MRFFRAKIAFLTFCFLLAGGAAFVRAVQAQPAVETIEGAAGGPVLKVKEAPIQTQVPIPGSTLETLATGIIVGRVRDLADYLNVVYNFLISIVGVVAAVMIMWGGFGYLTAGGDAGRVKVARERIGNALIGLILALSSYVILNTVNPELVKLKVPDVAPVKTVTQFIPFCDTLAKQLGASWSQVVAAPTPSDKDGDYGCGGAGYIMATQTDRVGNPRLDSTGKPIQVRRWCIMRGNLRADGSEMTAANEATKGYRIHGSNCAMESIFTAEVVDDDYAYVPQVCMPTANVSVDDLEKEFEKNGTIGILRGRLADCMSCPMFRQRDMQRMGLPGGPESCQMWMNIANNGDPLDSTFNIAKKKDKNWILDDSRPNQMYYCGYSRDRRRCVYSNIHCAPATRPGDRGGVDSCGDYNDETLYFCDNIEPEQRCFDEDFAAYTGTYADHLTPICLNDPCNLSSQCEQGGVYETAEIVGGGAEASRGLQILTAGIVNSAKCE